MAIATGLPPNRLRPASEIFMPIPMLRVSGPRWTAVVFLLVAHCGGRVSDRTRTPVPDANAGQAAVVASPGDALDASDAADTTQAEAEAAVTDMQAAVDATAAAKEGS